jgi:hypothetical protein
MGESGTGKTHALRTLLDAGVTPFILFTEPGMEVLGDLLPPEGQPCRFHWTYIPPSSAPWEALEASARQINNLTMEQLSRLSDISKREYKEFLGVVAASRNFICDRCGQNFGDVCTWGKNRAFVIDSGSGLAIMAMNLAVGSKPVKSQADWGIAVDNLERFYVKLLTDARCIVVLISHMEREQNEITGALSITAATLGRKLGPKLPRFFSDVIEARRDGTKFSWSTATPNMTLKARNVPLADGLPASFKPLIEAWRTRMGIEG